MQCGPRPFAATGIVGFFMRQCLLTCNVVTKYVLGSSSQKVFNRTATGLHYNHGIPGPETFSINIVINVFWTHNI